MPSIYLSSYIFYDPESPCTITLGQTIVETLTSTHASPVGPLTILYGTICRTGFMTQKFYIYR